MAKKHSTGKRKDKPSAALSRMNADDRDVLHSRLVRARSALMTAILALEHQGSVHGEVSASLRTHVYFPLRDLTDALEGKAVQS